MAIPAQPLLIGVDVSKATLAICLGPDQPFQSLDNERKSIARWLATLPAGPVCIAAEATNTFHLDLVDLAHRAGHTVYLVDGYRLSRYRDSIAPASNGSTRGSSKAWSTRSQSSTGMRTPSAARASRGSVR